MATDESVDLMLHIAQASIHLQQQIVDALTQYKATGRMPTEMLTSMGNGASPKKRGRKSKLNKDGTEKQPRKITAYNAWMQTKLKELKEAADHDPEQKHMETFKQAANIWATLPKEEKDRITAEFKDKQQHDEADAGVHAANAAVAAADRISSSDEEDEVPVMAPLQVSTPETSSDEEEAPAPAPKATPKPVSPPAPVLASPATDGKKKKKRKPAEPAAEPVKVEPISPAPAADAEKRRKKKKKKDA